MKRSIFITSACLLFLFIGILPLHAAPPFGWLDTVDGKGLVSGWTFDPDTSAQSIAVHFYIDGALAGHTTANRPRPDVNQVFGITGNHGYHFQIPTKWHDGKNHRIRVYAIDSGGRGPNPELSGSPKDFKLTGNSAPFGYLDRADCNGIFGWAKDPDVASIAVHLYADGPAGNGRFIASVIADQHRADVGNHAFSLPSAEWPSWLKDNRKHEIYAYAIDNAGGANPQLSDPGNREAVQCQGTPPPPPSETKFGIFYFLWHCIVSDTSVRIFPIGNSQRVQEGKENWLSVPLFHWWDEPAEGYYCLSEDDDLLSKHANQLVEAGIDYVVVDATNNPRTNDPNTHQPLTIQDPFEALLRVWSTIPNAPKIVPFVPVVEPSTSSDRMVDFLLDNLTGYKNNGSDMFLYHEGKPLLLVVDHPGFPPHAGALAELDDTYTIRRAWGFYGENQSNWSFLQSCQNGFRENQARIDCGQNITVRNGAPEQLAVAAAYQETYMSYKPTAVPKFHGKTFVQQFDRLWDYPHNTIPFVLITGWNEWIAQRWCVGPDGIQSHVCDQPGAFEFWPSGDAIFVDSYAREYNRDIEPAAAAGPGKPGDYYYRLMKECIGLYREGRECSTDSVDSPFVQNWHDPSGFVDPPAQCNARGWVKDADVPGSSIAVHVFLDGPAGSGTWATHGVANTPRPDVGGNYGYELSIPRTVNGQRTHNRTIWVHAIDPSGEGNNPLLHQSGSFRVNCP